MKKVLSQTIIAMAHHGYLEMEGGQLMIDFVARQCALPADTVSFKHDVTDIICQQRLWKLSGEGFQQTGNPSAQLLSLIHI